jgi:hypothetical protein
VEGEFALPGLERYLEEDGDGSAFQLPDDAEPLVAGVILGSARRKVPVPVRARCTPPDHPAPLTAYSYR